MDEAATANLIITIVGTGVAVLVVIGGFLGVMMNSTAVSQASRGGSTAWTERSTPDRGHRRGRQPRVVCGRGRDLPRRRITCVPFTCPWVPEGHIAVRRDAWSNASLSPTRSADRSHQIAAPRASGRQAGRAARSAPSLEPMARFRPAAGDGHRNRRELR